MKIKLDTSFTPWEKLIDYKENKHCHYHGVYLLAIFKQKPKLNIYSSKIIYIGETTKQTLSKRIYQFKRSAFLNASGHSGGRTYAEKFNSGYKVNEIPDNLYWSFYPTEGGSQEEQAKIKYIERYLIWQHIIRNKQKPVCNKA